MLGKHSSTELRPSLIWSTFIEGLLSAPNLAVDWRVRVFADWYVHIAEPDSIMAFTVNW